jgi:RNA-binding protein
MLNSKQRSNLRGLASVLDPVTQMGKSGINEAFIEGLEKVIEKRELIKFTVLETAPYTAKEAGVEVAEILGAEFVCAIGRKVVLYRRSLSDKITHIEF